MKRKTKYAITGTLEEVTTWLNEHKEELESQYGNISCDLDYFQCIDMWTLVVIA